MSSICNNIFVFKSLNDTAKVMWFDGSIVAQRAGRATFTVQDAANTRMVALRTQMNYDESSQVNILSQIRTREDHDLMAHISEDNNTVEFCNEKATTKMTQWRPSKAHGDKSQLEIKIDRNNKYYTVHLVVCGSEQDATLHQGSRSQHEDHGGDNEESLDEVFVTIYVDDLLILGEDKCTSAVKGDLATKFKVTSKMLTFSLHKCALGLIQKNGNTVIYPVDLPQHRNLYLHVVYGTCDDNDALLYAKRSLAGTLQYLVMYSRMELANIKVMRALNYLVGKIDLTSSFPSLPNAVLYAILETTTSAKDVVALLGALPPMMLPPELIALRDLGAVVDLACHWPVVHVTTIPIQYARLGIAALPAFAGVYIDAGFTALDWLDATLPPTMPVTLVVDPSVSGALSAFVYAWGDRITNVIIKKHEVQPDLIPDMLGRCVNVQSGPRATSLSLDCVSVSDPTALAIAIQACSTLATLRLDRAVDVQTALVALPTTLHHVTTLSLSYSSEPNDIGPGGLLRKLDQAKIVSIRYNGYPSMRLDDVMNFLVTRTSLESVTLYNWTLPAITEIGAWPRLSSITLHGVQFDHMESVPAIIQWLSTSRHLTSVDFTSTKLGKEGVLALARALPVWMARGLTTLTLYGTGLTDVDVVVLAIALASKCNRRALKVDVSSCSLTLTSASFLLATLGACCNVTLRLGYPFGNFGPQYRRYNAANEDRIQDLVNVHGLQSTEPGVFTSPTRASSPWETL
ncbi:hypothetical protein SPRG_09733 [Saprolegnia parasitica CBS 223.65]|uniref:Uncharacterized protein n=1 Tax=Saprolegnia parasitica (strain CBS 223.65) TaxID=695850 RepID=A0A067C389_SAPPC|nr:hypothetical protein SPRG_09733 [Saprolegnia parasitica CBS 223.65]KDO25003.1 hypothetical protein SPRG_09733 [Saprolegnia parasitica CBS 223.65]|eukprot:XP_012204272.1 hypothetical protein SPRG_09733 [Saprolegnia parasitica CBS 223.65]